MLNPIAILNQYYEPAIDEALRILYGKIPTGHWVIVYRHDEHAIYFDQTTNKFLGLPQECTKINLIELQKYVTTSDADRLLGILGSIVTGTLNRLEIELRLWNITSQQWRWFAVFGRILIEQKTQNVIISGSVFDIQNHYSINFVSNQVPLSVNTEPIEVTEWNDFFTNLIIDDDSVRILGVEDGEEYTQRFQELSPERQPNGRLSAEYSRELMKKAYDTGYVRFEWVHQSLEGILIPCEISLSCVICNSKPALHVYIQDLRIFKRKELELERERTLLQQVLDSCPVCFLILTNNVIRYATPFTKNFFSVDVGSRIDELGIDDTTMLILQNILLTLQVSVWYPMTITTHAGELKYMMVNISNTSYFDEGGTMLWLVDITKISLVEMELRKALEAAKESSYAKGAFLANVSHEIRTPLNAIMGMAELLKLSTLTEQQRVQIENIKTASVSLLKIINDILDFSKIGANKFEVIEQPFDVLSFLYDTSNMISIKAMKKELAFVMNISKDLPTKLIGDELRLKQILINLLNNSIKFTNEGCVKIDVTFTPASEGRIFLHFVVSDTGIGIRAEEMDKLFVEFEQIDTRRNRQITGTGLGLPISKRLIELMGGSISVESEYGVGSVFSFTIQAGVEDTNPLATVNEPYNKYILCFEPNPYYAQSILRMCSDFGVPVEIVESAEQWEAQLTNPQFTHLFFDVKKGLIPVRKHTSSLGNTRLVAMKTMREAYNDTMLPPNTHSVLKPFLLTTFAKIMNNEKLDTTKQTVRNDPNALGSIQTLGVTILVVDDNPVNLKVATALLKHYNIEVDECESGFEALARVKTTKYDMILMDHMMPAMDGIDTTQAIRKLGGIYETIPIIALSANAIIGMHEKYVQAGMNDFIAKPIDIKHLNQILRSYLPVEKILDDRQDTDQTIMYTDSTGLAIVLQEIPEINLTSGLQKIGGDIDSYLVVLKSFMNSTQPRIKKIEFYRKTNKLNEFSIEVHGLKSALANIGADELSEQSRKLEIASQSEDLILVDNMLDKFLMEMQAFLNKLFQLFPQEPTESQTDGELSLLAQQNDELLESLALLDQDNALHILNTLRTYRFGNPFDDMLTEMYDAVSVYEYDSAEIGCQKIKEWIEAK